MSRKVPVASKREVQSPSPPVPPLPLDDDDDEQLISGINININPDELVDELAAFGVCAATELLITYGSRRIAQALAFVRSIPPGQARNPPGLLVYLVKKPGPIPNPKPTKDVNKYTSGQYGHVVRR